jgi:error-prone DNA polymerase
LFERFLSEERGEWPDIDLDLPSGAAREEIIQHLYRKYGPHCCAMTGSVITYRGRSAVRDLGKVLELPSEGIDGLAKSLGHYEDPRAPSLPPGSTDAAPLPQRMREAGLDPESPAGQRFATLWTQIQDLPRHFAQHPGGMIIAAGRLDEVVPLEPAAMPGRVVMQWDKDDVEDLGIVKIDLLGLGMLAALAEARALVPRHHGVPFDLHTLPPDDRATYDLIARGDTVGVFQIESRAQMAILPRTQPRTFYDLVVQVGLIRPGPILGDMVHPYLKRRSGHEPVRFIHPSLEPVLSRTLGIPLFQEQIMRVAMIAGGFTGGQADELRRAMGGKHGAEKMARMVAALRQGMAARGITGAPADEIVQSITAFAAYGFPESHAISFAYLTYASAYLKAHHPAAFYCSLLNAWPMGFYHPATLVKDAQRHGVRVLPIEINASQTGCTLIEPATPREPDAGSTAPAQGAAPERPPPAALRMGLRYVRGLSQATAEAIVDERSQGAYTSIGDLRRRVPFLSARDLSTLAEIGAFARLDGQPSRRSALWQVSALGDREGLLAGAVSDADSPLADMTLAERVAADFHGATLSVGPHPVALLRSQLAAQGVLTSQQASSAHHGARVRSAGLCIVRQRPPSAKGFCFLTLEDEAGLLNIIVPPALYEAQQATLRGSALLIVDGILQRQDGAVSIKADQLAPL